MKTSGGGALARAPAWPTHSVRHKQAHLLPSPTGDASSSRPMRHLPPDKTSAPSIGTWKLIAYAKGQLVSDHSGCKHAPVGGSNVSRCLQCTYIRALATPANLSRIKSILDGQTGRLPRPSLLETMELAKYFPNLHVRAT